MTEHHPAVVAILGWPTGSEVTITGSGILVSPRVVLTARHVVRASAHAKHFRVFSPTAGIRTVKKKGIYPRRSETIPGLEDELALIRLRSPMRGVRPALIRYQVPPPGESLVCSGFGGRNGGLLEVRSVTALAGSTFGPWGFRIDPDVFLGPGDSGCPLLPSGAGTPEDRKVTGIYYGREGVETIGLALDPVQKWIEKTRRSLEAGLRPVPDWSIAGGENTKRLIAAGETQSHAFELGRQTSGRRRVLLSVVVGASAVPDTGDFPRLRVRMFHRGKEYKRGRREMKSWFQAVRVRRPYAGDWRVEIESFAGAAQYQLGWTLFVSEPVSRTPRELRRGPNSRAR